MERAVVRLADRHLAWLIAILASANAAAQAFQGFLDGRLDHLALWTGTAVAMVALALVIETIKMRRLG